MSDKQIELFAPDEISECELLPQEAIERLKNNEEEISKYTAIRLCEKQPKLYNAARVMLAKGASVSETANLLGIHPYTIEALREREHDYIEKAKKRLSRNSFAAAELAVEKIKDKLLDFVPQKIDDLYKLTLIAGSLSEKGNLLSGGVTERIALEDVKTFKDNSEYEKAVFGEVIDVDNTKDQ